MSAEIKAKKEPLPYNAQQRAQAVLSIWSEHRRPAERGCPVESPALAAKPKPTPLA